jgi:catechol 2,3-dioxygenase-like lactoylglutathione lyase family enzyme
MLVTAIRHTGIVVSNMETSLPFYRDLLGLEIWWNTIEQGPEMDAVTGIPSARVHTVKLRAPDCVTIELQQYLNQPRPVHAPAMACDVGCSHVALQVRNLDVLYQTAVRAGIRFNTPPVVAPGGKAKVTYCRDPEGVILELVEIL